MKKKLIYFLIGLFILVGAVIFIHHRLTVQGNAGYVIVGFDRWIVESSLFVMGIALILAFILFYALIRTVSRTLRLPKTLKIRGTEQRNRRSREALITGLIETAEGNWEKAEKNLIRHAANSGIPLINYLIAARAAHSRGAHEQRDEYLKLAHQSAPEAELAVGLTRAELQLSTKQFEEALQSLTHLNRIAPSHAAVLKLMHQAYAQMEDWEALQRLIPTLHKNKVLMETEIKLLETETYSALLKQKSEIRNPTVLRELWRQIPEHIRAITGIQTLYFAAMIEAGAGEEIEEPLRLALGREWNETLLILYGCVQMADTEKHLRYAEAFLALHPRDAVLLRVLGKLALRIRHTEKAREYLQRSLDSEPSVEAYQLMGDLLFAQKDFAGASNFYRSGLMLASNEVVAQIEQNPDGESSRFGAKEMALAEA